MNIEKSKGKNEIVKLIFNSKSSSSIHLEKISMYEVETQTFSNDKSDLLSKEAGDEARLTRTNKYGLLSLDEYQIIRTGEEHCLKKYFSDDDISISDEDITLEKQIEQINLDEKLDRTDNLNNNASAMLHLSHSNLSNTLLIDDTTNLTATLAKSTSSHISHSRYIENSQQKSNLLSVRSYVRQAINSCRENLILVDQLLENIPLSYENIHKRKVHRTNCILNIPNSIKGLQYNPSTSVQTE